MKRFIRLLVYLFVVIFFQSSCEANQLSQELPGENDTTPIAFLSPSETPTTTVVPSSTPTPTSTPVPEFDLNDFFFPFDLNQVKTVWDQLSIPDINRNIEYHIVNRTDRSIPYEDPCGYHPGDLIGVIGSRNYYEAFEIDTRMPYSGKLVDKWITQGNDDGFTFFIGMSDNKKVYLNSYHTQVSDISIGKIVDQGNVYGTYTYTRDHCNCGYFESKVHLTLFNPANNGGLDFLRDEVNIVDITSYALPSTLQAAFNNGVKVLIVYEGPNYCDLTSQEKITRILTEYLPNAGYCVKDNSIMYCGGSKIHNKETFSFVIWDARSIMLTPREN